MVCYERVKTCEWSLVVRFVLIQSLLGIEIYGCDMRLCNSDDASAGVVMWTVV